MLDEILIKDYLRAHGVNDVEGLSYDELNAAYEKCIRDGIKYYNDSSKENNTTIIEKEELNIQNSLVGIKNIPQMYTVIYDFLHFYSPSDIITFLAESKFQINYKKLSKIVHIVHARIQDEMLDKIALALETIPVQERETLINYYEKNRADIIFLDDIYNRFKSNSILEYTQVLASSKLEIMKTFLPKHLETEYKPYYDNTIEKKQLVINILNISSIYSKERLFDMTIYELNNLYQVIVEQNKQKEKQDRMVKKYIELLEDYTSVSDTEFKNVIEDAMKTLSHDSMQELISYFGYKNHFITNKISNIIKLNS